MAAYAAGFHLVHGLNWWRRSSRAGRCSHLLDDLIAEVLLADERVVGTCHRGGDGDGDAFGIAVRVPEIGDVAPRIQWRDELLPFRITHGRHLEQAQSRVEDLEDIAH